MKVSGTDRRPKASDLLPSGSQAFVIEKTERDLQQAVQRVQDWDAELLAAKNELRARNKARFRAVQPVNGGRRGEGQIGEDTLELQAAVHAAGQRVARAQLWTARSRMHVRELQLRLKLARRGLNDLLVHVVDSARGELVLGKAETANEQYARLLRESAAHDRQEKAKLAGQVARALTRGRG